MKLISRLLMPPILFCSVTMAQVTTIPTPSGGSGGLSADSVRKIVGDSMATVADFNTTGSAGKTATTGKVWYDPVEGVLKIGTDQAAPAGASADSVKQWISDSLNTLASIDTNNASLYNATTGKTWYDPATGTLKIAKDQTVGSETVLLYAAAIGLGMPTDTALFRQGYAYPSLLHDATCSDTLVITKIVGVVGGSSPDVDVQFLYDANQYDATPTAVNTSALTVTSTTTGSSTTTINNATIVPGTYLWPVLTETAAQPTSLRLFVYGYRKPI